MKRGEPGIDERPIGRFVDRHTILFDVAYRSRRATCGALTDPASIGAWFAHIELDPRLGGRVTIDPRHDRSTPTAPAEGVIIAFEPERLLAYRFHAGKPQWPESELRFELRTDGDGSGLVFSQRLAPATVFPDDQLAGPGTFPPATCASWQCILQDGLARFLAGGRLPGYDDWDHVLPGLTSKYRDMIITDLVP